MQSQEGRQQIGSKKKMKMKVRRNNDQYIYCYPRGLRYFSFTVADLAFNAHLGAKEGYKV